MIKTQPRLQIKSGSTSAPLLWNALALTALAIMSGVGPISEVDRDPNPHAFQGMIINGWTDERCNRCHTIDPIFSHPTGFRPDRPLPKRFPLQNGQMTCLTCHDGSDSSLHALARRSNTSMLRSPFQGQAFCAECHDQGSFSSRLGHASAVDKAHLLWPDEKRQSHDLQMLSGDIDRETESCLHCHDGMLAGAVGPGHGGQDLFVMGANQEHPVGIPYRVSRQRRGMKRLVNQHALDQRIRLFDGNVGCGSCHSVYSQLKNQLVMSNYGSALCLSCHDG